MINSSRRISSVVRPATFFLLVLASALSACSPATSVTNMSRDSVPDSVLAVVAGRPIDVHELLTQYSKIGQPDTSGVDSLAIYEDFLKRYVDFKLKVLEAKEAGYFELPDLRDEIEAYRSQLARPYLLEQEVTEPLIRELYDRRKQQVEASHILIRVEPSAPPSDTLEAYNKILAIRDSLVKGMDFSELAFRNSEDPSARSAPGSAGYRGYLGFFGGGRMVKEFEDAAFRTDAGEVSDIFRSQFGYHILKVLNRIPTPPDLRMAHIMIQPKGPTPADSAVALARIREVQSKLAEGQSFGDLAREYSDDKASAGQGGELQRVSFDTGLPVSMRDVAFSMEEDEVSDIIETPFGFHVVKVLEKLPLGTLEEMHDDLNKQISRLPRSGAAQTKYAESVRRRLGEWADTTLIRQWADTMTPDSLFRTVSRGVFDDSTRHRILVSLGDSTYTVARLSAFLGTRRLPNASTPIGRIWASIDDFLNDAAIDHEVSALEERDPSFGATMDEFRDGLTLFRLMEDSVWTAASSDSLGLRDFYDLNADQYRYQARTRIVSFTSKSDSLLASIGVRVREGEALDDVFAEVKADSLLSLKRDTTMVEGLTNSIFDKALDAGEREIVDPQPYNNAFIVLYNDGVVPARKKKFDEARAEVITQYQKILEDRLLGRLRTKYEVRLFRDNLEKAFRENLLVKPSVE
jgi:peptidyl-prolyl cis-trans isomerase SurA